MSTSPTDKASDEADKQLTIRDWVAVAAMMLGLFMAILDIQIVSSSLRQLSAALSATLDEIAWVQSSFLIAEVIVIPLTGWLVRALSTRFLFAGACAAFTVMSLACALAWDLPSMIVFRVLQGLSGGVMIPLVFSNIFLIFPPRLQGRATIVTGLFAIAAPIMGPVVGGWITEVLSWHWLFLVNVPIGILVTGLVYKLVDIDKPDFALLRRVDFLGIIWIAVFLGTLEYTLKEGTAKDWFQSSIITWAAIISVAALGLFLWRELRQPEPVVQLRTFRNGNFTIGCVLGMLVGMVLYGPVYLLPVILSSIAQLNSLQIGKIMLVTGLAMAVSAVVSNVIEKRIDPRLMTTIGFIGLGIGCVMDSNLTAEVGYEQLFWSQAVRGSFMMLAFLPATTMALGTLPAADVQNGSSLYNLMRNLGGAFSLAGITWFQSVRFDYHYDRIRSTISVSRPAFKALIADQAASSEPMLQGLRNAELASLGIFVDLVRREAMIAAFNDVWFMMGALMFLGLLLVPLIQSTALGGNPSHAH